MTTALVELTRLKAERDEARLLLEDLTALRSGIVMTGTEAEVNAHDARFDRAKRRYERALAAIERVRTAFEADQFPAEGLLGKLPVDAGHPRPKTP